MWALFSDTIPDIRAALLVDNSASVEAIRNSLADTLGAAGPNDTVIISYSDHGSHDHRIAAYDTSLNSLADTCISMKELAMLFKNHKQK